MQSPSEIAERKEHGDKILKSNRRASTGVYKPLIKDWVQILSHHPCSHCGTKEGAWRIYRNVNEEELFFCLKCFNI